MHFSIGTTRQEKLYKVPEGERSVVIGLPLSFHSIISRNEYASDKVFDELCLNRIPREEAQLILNSNVKACAAAEKKINSLLKRIDNTGEKQTLEKMQRCAIAMRGKYQQHLTTYRNCKDMGTPLKMNAEMYVAQQNSLKAERKRLAALQQDFVVQKSRKDKNEKKKKNARKET